MRLLHLSDLHLGKRVNEFSMVEDQRYILRKVLEIIDEEKPDGVMIAGDIYDKSVPNEEAVKLLGGFLSNLAKRELQVYIISGNHDSAVKLAFASDLIDRSGIHFSPVYEGKVEPFSLEEMGMKSIFICFRLFGQLLSKRYFRRKLTISKIILMRAVWQLTTWTLTKQNAIF